jgi:hypothetical protein
MQSTVENQTADEIWPQMGPLLEQAMSRLNEKERTLLALRYFENRTSEEAASLLGIGEWAARKRSARALEKLRKYFSKHGVKSTTAIIAASISANSLQLAPMALAKTVTAAAVVKGAIANGQTLILIKTTLKIMASTKLKIGIVSAVVAAVVATTTVTTVKHFSKSHGSVEVSVINHSRLTLTNVSVSGDHFAQVGWTMTPGMSARMLCPVDARGWLYFEANGQKIDSRGKDFRDYFTLTSRRPLLLEIDADLKITYSSGR